MRSAHLRRVAEQLEDRREAQYPRQAGTSRFHVEEGANDGVQDPLIDDIAQSIFAMTLTDASPNIDAQPNRLWVSREEYQNSSTSYTSSINVPSLHDVLGSIHRLDTPTHVPLPFDTESEASSFVNSTEQRRARTPRRERHKSTKTALSKLDIVEKRAKAAQFKLETPSPTLDLLKEVENEALQIQAIFDNVERNVASVMSRKVTVKNTLTRLHASILASRRLHPPDDTEPLQYQAGLLFVLS